MAVGKRRIEEERAAHAAMAAKTLPMLRLEPAPPDDTAARRLLASVRDTANACGGMMARLAHGIAGVDESSPLGRDAVLVARLLIGHAEILAWLEKAAGKALKRAE